MLGLNRGKDVEKTTPGRQHRKQLSMSSDHTHQQVVQFNDNSHEAGGKGDIGRELFSFPKPEHKENMSDYINNHKQGDIFPYIAVTGKEEETKDNRISRLRAFTSPYNKSSKPDMRVNGVMLDMLIGSMHIDDLKNYVNEKDLSRNQLKENKRFKNIGSHAFEKPYIQLKRITGEFVPLLSGTSDYTDLFFSLHDGRLLDNQVVVQSNKIPTNNVGIIELTCDYCIPTKDIKQLSLRYELARPIMKDNFQWGTISLSISVDESDTPYLTPKIEAMAVIKAPYTAMEEQSVDPDHKDVTYTANQIAKFRQMFTDGDIMDNDEPKKEKSKMSSYSKSTIRGLKKGTAGPEHLGNLDGWGQLEGMKKPLIEEGLASVSADSGDEDEVTNQKTLKEWEMEQENMRQALKALKDEANSWENLHQSLRETSEDLKREERKFKKRNPKKSSLKKKTSTELVPRGVIFNSSSSDESEPEIMKLMKEHNDKTKPSKGSVSFNIHEV
jgi:hypothetical protein